MTSFWGELKRRNVVRVAIAYAVVAWLSIEVSATTFPMFNLPEWAATLVTVLLLIGFPVAIIFAWAFELTPEGLKKEKDVDRSDSITHTTGRKLDFVIIGVLVVAVGFLLVDKIYLSEGDTAADEVIATERQSIAVLPFVNMSSDSEQEFFSDGLSEEILNLLTKIPALKVIARTSSFSFKGKNEDVRNIGEALGVKTVLEGSVRKSGDRVRITAQLIDVADGSHIWSETYERTMTDIFAIQDDVAAAIIGALQIHVGVIPTRGRPTDNTEAYALFLKARVLVSRNQTNPAEELLLKAIELDLNFAEAHEMLASHYWRKSNQKRTVEAAAKALAIDPDLVLAQALYQSAKIGTRLAGIEAYEQAFRKQPGNRDILEALSWALLQAGYLEEAVRLQERAVDLDPLSVVANIDLGLALFAIGRTNEAVAAMELAGRLSSNLSNLWLRGIFDLVVKRDETAIALFEAYIQQWENGDATWVRSLVTGARDAETGQAHLDRRIPEIIASVPEHWAERRGFLQWRLTTWYLVFGFTDRFIDIILDHDPTDSAWDWLPELILFDGIMHWRLGFTAHPKFLELAETMGLVKIWEQRGPPDFCEKRGGQWVCE